MSDPEIVGSGDEVEYEIKEKFKAPDLPVRGLSWQSASQKADQHTQRGRQPHGVGTQRRQL